MKHNYTPGPWSMSSQPYDSIPWHHMYGPDGKHLMHADRSDEEKIASTFLITAAPDLLEFAQMIADESPYKYQRDAANDVIAKALGQ